MHSERTSRHSLQSLLAKQKLYCNILRNVILIINFLGIAATPPGTLDAARCGAPRPGALIFLAWLFSKSHQSSSLILKSDTLNFLPPNWTIFSFVYSIMLSSKSGVSSKQTFKKPKTGFATCSK